MEIIMQLTDVIKGAVVTEKALKTQGEFNRYSFLVDVKAHKGTIRAAVEQLFDVTVLDVHTVIRRGKYKKVGRSVGLASSTKRAFVTLKDGDKIELVEGA